jgi:hypothetical protein
MNKKSKEIISYVALFVVIFLLPNLLIYYFKREDSKVFHQRVHEDNEICRQRAKEDSREVVWCDEIKQAATLAYSETKSSDNVSLLLMLFQPLLFILLVSQYNLRKQFEELKEKTDV